MGASAIAGAVGSAVVGKVAGKFLGGDEASASAGRAQDLSAEQLAFERQKYEDWKETYGGIEENLSSYYSNLTPDYYEARGLEAFRQEQADALQQVRATLAQRGIADSGIAAATELSFAQQGAKESARIRAEAPSMAMEEQRGFLQVGLGQNPGSSLSSALGSAASDAQRASEAYGQATGAAVAPIAKAVGSGLSDYVTKSGGLGGAVSSAWGSLTSGLGSIFCDNRLKTNLQRVGTANNGLGLYSWEWTEEAKSIVGDQPPQGYIAQEVEERYPQAVKMVGAHKTIDYSEIPNA